MLEKKKKNVWSQMRTGDSAMNMGNFQIVQVLYITENTE